jgi:WD40 repeat protein
MNELRLATGIRPAAVGVASLLAALAALAATCGSCEAQSPQEADRGGAKPAAGARVDRYGDPLPAGALVRIGTVRSREASLVKSICVSPDGKVLVSIDFANTARVWDLTSGKEVRQFPTGNDQLPVITADGKNLITGEEKVYIREIASGRVLSTLPYPYAKVGLLRDGNTLVVVTDGGIHLWDLAAKKELRRIRCPSPNRVVFCPDRKKVAVSSHGDIHVIDLVSGEDIVPLKSHGPDAIALSPDGQTLATARSRQGVSLWDAATGRQRFQLTTEGGPMSEVIAFSPDGKLLAIVDGATPPSLWDVTTGRSLISCESALKHIQALAFAPDGKTLVAGGANGQLQVCDVATGRLRTLLARSPDAGSRIVFGADGKTLLTATSSADESGGVAGTVCLWDAATGSPLQVSAFGKEVDFSADGSLVGMPGRDGYQLLKADTRKPAGQVPFTAKDTATALSGDGKRVATGSADRSVRIWDVAAGKQLQSIDGKLPAFTKLALSPDGTLLLAASLKMVVLPGKSGLSICTEDADDSWRVWDVASGKERWRAVAVSQDLAFSPDGKWIATAGQSRTPEEQVLSTEVRLWEAATGRERWVGVRHAKRVVALAFSPDGRGLATGSEDGELCLWEVATGKLRLALRAHDQGVLSASFSPDGRLLAVACGDRTGLVWDLLTRPRFGPAELTAEWEALASADAERAYSAVCRLAGDHERAVAWLRTRLRPGAAPDRPRVARLIAELDGDLFTDRERAEKELEAMGSGVAADLRRALDARPSAEAARRLRRLLEGMDFWSGEELRSWRALEVLERVGTSEARKVLQGVADGPAGARLTQAGKESLGRLARLAARP